MKLTTVTALLAGLVGGLLVVVGVLSLHLLPKLGVGTPPTLEPTAAASTPATSENTCSYENMPMAPVLPASITEPGAGGKFTWVSGGKPYYCFEHQNNAESTGCPMAIIIAQDEDGEGVTVYSSMYNHPVVEVTHIPQSVVNADGFTYALVQYVNKNEMRLPGDIPTSASNLLSVLTEGYPLDETSCSDME